jgi:BclB C-terminal domain-containing protein
VQVIEGPAQTVSLADPGSVTFGQNPTPNRYPFCNQHTAICVAIRSETNDAGAMIDVVRWSAGVPTSFGPFAAPPTGTSTSYTIAGAVFADGDEIEVTLTGVNAQVEVVVEFLGPAGQTGPTGPEGATGATGPAGSTAIIPFASGTPVALATTIAGAVDTGAVVAFGSSVDGVAVISPLNLINAGVVVVPQNMAFSMPRDGALVQLSASFSFTEQLTALPLGGTVLVAVEVWSSPTPNDAFTFTGLGLKLAFTPDGSGVIGIGQFQSGTAGPVSIAVENQDRILLVAYVTSDGIPLVTTAVGFLSAGLAIG